MPFLGNLRSGLRGAPTPQERTKPKQGAPLNGAVLGLSQGAIICQEFVRAKQGGPA